MILLLMFTARIKEYKSRMQRLALSNGLVPGHDNYIKFIILSRSRSGSNYLVDLLNSHENIVCFNELFSRGGETYWGLPGYSSKNYKSDSFRQFKETNPVRFLSSHVYNKHPILVSAVGFKLFYNQAKKGKSSSLWDYLGKLYNLKIIHLKRKNMLNIVASKKLAEKSNEWVKRRSHSSDKMIQVELSYDECISQFEKTRSWEMESNDLFLNHEIIDVYYEDLVSNVDKVMSDVQTFLGVERKSLFSTTNKQSTRAVSDVIVNFQELKCAFKGTEWEYLFDV